MATEPKPDLPSPDECVRRAWSAAQEAQSRGLPMSSQAVWWQESQAWSLLALALRGQPIQEEVMPNGPEGNRTPTESARLRVAEEADTSSEDALWVKEDDGSVWKPQSNPDVLSQSVPQPPTPAPVARRKPGPKPKESADDVVARLKAEWEQEERDE